MKRFQCSYVANERPQSLEIWAKDAQDAVCAAMEQIGESDYRRMEISDEQGMIYFRQGPSRCLPTFRKFARTQKPYAVPAGLDIRASAAMPGRPAQDTQRLAS